jgi:hypothetical protein
MNGFPEAKLRFALNVKAHTGINQRSRNNEPITTN